MPNILSVIETQAIANAALSVAAQITGNVRRDRIASVTAQQLRRMLGEATVGVFFKQNSEHFALAAVSGPKRHQASRLWQTGLPVPAARLSAAALPALPDEGAPILVPLRAGKRLFGLLAIAAPARTPQLRSVAQRFAAHVAAPIDRALLAAELRDAAEAAAASTDLDGTLRAILAGVRRVIPADAAGILVREGEYARVIAVDNHPDEAIGHLLPITRDLSLEGPLLRGEAVHIDQPNFGQYDNSATGAGNIGSYIGAPLLAGQEIAGILCIDGWRPGAFDAEDVRRACEFGAHVGTALARARTYSLTVAEASVLREAAFLATLDTDENDILQRILDGLRRVVRCDAVSIILRDGHEAYIAATDGYPDALVNFRFEIAGHAVLETALLQGHPYLTTDLQAEENLGTAPVPLVVRGHLSVPLITAGETVGMISINSQQVAAFGLEDLARVELFAGYATAALANARLHAAIREAAERDPVTGLFNHRAIHAHLSRELVRAGTEGRPLAIAMLDLDGFKLYNDTHGHPAGDAALQTVANALLGACRPDDIVGRYGGDEFLVIIPGLDRDEAAALGLRLRNAVAACTTCPTIGNALPLRVSVGIASFPYDGIERDLLVARADARLYESKQRGDVVAPGHASERDAVEIGDAFSVLDGLVTAVDRKDRYTRVHSEEVTELALLLGAELGLSPDTLRSVRLAGLLHDVGKIGVPDRILKKPGRLTPEEIEIMNSHPALGEAIVAGLPGLAEIRTGVRSHHERWDGRGYPDSLAGEQIPLLGRILAVPDCYSAMTTNRPYRAALSHDDALEEIRRGAGTQFDPAIVSAFLRVMKRQPRSAFAGITAARAARSA